MSSLFTKIIKGEIPSYKIIEDDSHLAFLDIAPLSRGHTLVIPKKETDYIFEINSEEYKNLWIFAKKVAVGMNKILECKRIAIMVIGLEVPHTHIHLVPINEMGDVDFRRDRISFTKSEMQEIASMITSAI